MISGVIHLVTDLVLAPLEVGCELKNQIIKSNSWTCSGKSLDYLGRNDKLVSDASFLGPLAYEFFRGSILTDNGCQS